ncbi:transporter [Bradyrhizobium jicamae]|nr:transporter [Bradyrhizobium jicamae]
MQAWCLRRVSAAGWSTGQLGSYRSGVVTLICHRAWLIAAFAVATMAAAHAEGCPQPSDAIATDRPDVTNSSIVVPVGSLQNENGVNLTGRDGGRSVDGTNSRWRLGIAPCLEVLVDLPNYFGSVKSPGASGFSDVAPAIKWQVSPLPGKIDLSITAGVALPTGAVGIAGRGAQPYIQLPWSWELHDGWGVSGMFTEFFRPAELTGQHMTEATFVLERKLTERISLFTEYVGDYPDGAVPTQLINSGGMYQLTPTQQLDFHVAFGLNRNSPSYIVGVGYSFRVDGLFR